MSFGQLVEVCDSSAAQILSAEAAGSGIVTVREAHNSLERIQVCLVSLSGKCRTPSGTPTKACPHHWQQPLHANDVHDPREIVGEHMQGHLGCYFRQALHQEVRCAHAHLQRTERMLDRLAACTHRLWVCIETLLHSFEHMLMLPSRNAP